MKDLIDIVKPGLTELAEKRKPADVEVELKETVVEKAYFDFYVKLYKAHPEYSKQQYILGVAEQFNKSPQLINDLYTKFRWYTRAKKEVLKSEYMPPETGSAVNELLSDAFLISKMGTRLITDYIVNANPQLMQAKDIFKLGMLVVECIRVTNEVNIGTGQSGQAQGQVINLVINE
jgi:hypothetical protein